MLTIPLYRIKCLLSQDCPTVYVNSYFILSVETGLFRGYSNSTGCHYFIYIVPCVEISSFFYSQYHTIYISYYTTYFLRSPYQPPPLPIMWFTISQLKTWSDWHQRGKMYHVYNFPFEIEWLGMTPSCCGWVSQNLHSFASQASLWIINAAHKDYYVRSPLDSSELAEE